MPRRGVVSEFTTRGAASRTGSERNDRATFRREGAKNRNHAGSNARSSQRRKLHSANPSGIVLANAATVGGGLHKRRIAVSGQPPTKVEFARIEKRHGKCTETVIGEVSAMQDRAVIREKAIRIAIRTGWMPDLDLIWESQKREGYQPCFGSFCESCKCECCWAAACRKLAEEPVDTPLPRPRFGTNESTELANSN